MRAANAAETRIARKARQIKTDNAVMSQHMPVNYRQRCAKQAVIRGEHQARSGKAANLLAALPKNGDDARSLPDQDANVMTAAMILHPSIVIRIGQCRRDERADGDPAPETCAVDKREGGNRSFCCVAKASAQADCLNRQYRRAACVDGIRIGGHGPYHSHRKLSVPWPDVPARQIDDAAHASADRLGLLEGQDAAFGVSVHDQQRAMSGIAGGRPERPRPIDRGAREALGEQFQHFPVLPCVENRNELHAGAAMRVRAACACVRSLPN